MRYRNLANYSSISLIKTKYFDEVKHDEDQIIAMKIELNQFERKIAWPSVSKSKDHPIIGIE